GLAVNCPFETGVSTRELYHQIPLPRRNVHTSHIARPGIAGYNRCWHSHNEGRLFLFCSTFPYQASSSIRHASWDEQAW
ncbi:hypothetical protein ACFLXX_01570, partial [Chloroflexota bacterium]